MRPCRYEGVTTKDGKIASHYGKYIFSEDGDRESHYAGKVTSPERAPPGLLTVPARQRDR